MEPKAKANQPRAAVRINSKLEKNLAAYIAAASAAGASLLAAQPAEGKVVYTPTNVTISFSGTPLDLNNDGTADFSLAFREQASHSIALVVIPAVTGNAVRPSRSFGAAAGFFGVPVGVGEKFVSNTHTSYGPGVEMAQAFAYGNYSSSRGPWINTTNRYLGIKFLINGQTHYGWARLTVSKGLNAVLTGYAYETIPNVSIVEGHTFGAEKAVSFAPSDLPRPVPRPASLGALALGADGLSMWRREEEAAAAA
jgi:hypothetical protein